MSSHNLHQKALINALLSQSTSFVRSWKFVAYIEVVHDFCCSNQSFVVFVWTQLEQNCTKKFLRATSREEFFSKKGKKYNNATLKNKVPMNPTCDSKVGYL